MKISNYGKKIKNKRKKERKMDMKILHCKQYYMIMHMIGFIIQKIAFEKKTWKENLHPNSSLYVHDIHKFKINMVFHNCHCDLAQIYNKTATHQHIHV
jgi:hypothetical protein